MSTPEEFERLDCSAVIADVWLLLDNECDEQARRRLQCHIDTCKPCLEHYGIEQQLKSLISRKCGGDQAPSGLRERLTLEIRKTVIVTDVD
ncbi:mycothiol system anti-sigma-R factor [Williamsia sterculiae]|uniref:Mycothiol system anti-sigma-R factor n=1 Tax=Williamsia sterculiae TaxID=1344003 RepID=A0A1N7FYV1_9NOCA|nr:mycothiol system anti-sigma-R factor [Williamsia sterculiae]SIS05522.1 mycothiol system anti-sigma-R factor [Williamsia sterculiae]